MEVRQPAEPVEKRAEEDDEGGDGAERVQPGSDESPSLLRSRRERDEDREDERRPADEGPRGVLLALDAEEREHREEDRDPAEVDEEGRVRPGHPNRVHAAKRDLGAGRRLRPRYADGSRAEPGSARREPTSESSERFEKEGAHGGNPVSPMLYQPRVSSKSSGASAAADRPLIASPRPCETRASTAASR